MMLSAGAGRVGNIPTTDYDRSVPDAAAAVIFDAEGRVLLMREAYERERYGLPGGVIEEGESPRSAAIRETREELGLAVLAHELIAVYHLRTNRSDGLRFFFRCEIVGGGTPTVPPTGEVASFVWARVDALPEPLTTTAPYAVEDAAKGLRGIYREIDARTV
jgi:ADP-ribose pyrophosphatase YjhB (NUDIX family)